MWPWGLNRKTALALHCLGDSHADVFRLIEHRGTLKRTQFNYCLVRGASNMGLANPQSRTNAAEIFETYMQHIIKRKDYVVFCLGEVDCGFVIWYRAAKYQLAVQHQFELSIKNYLGLLERAAVHCQQVCVTSVPLPTIKDGQDWGEVASLRKEVTASLLDRTALTIEYNERLKEFCQQSDAYYIDLAEATLDPDSGLVKDECRNPNLLDHHLDPEKIAPIIEAQLRNLGFR